VSPIGAALRADSLAIPGAPSAWEMRNTAERCYEGNQSMLAIMTAGATGEF